MRPPGQGAFVAQPLRGLTGKRGFGIDAPEAPRATGLDWVIVGGGIHGVHIAARLLDDGGVDPRRLRIVDPGPRLLDRWWVRAEVTGMAYLRSTSVHHLDTHPLSLRRFARNRMRDVPGLYAAPYDRPVLELFRAHTQHVIERFGLEGLRLRDSVVSCRPGAHAVELDLEVGAPLSARRVVLATGSGAQLDCPDWVPQGHPRIQHVFRPGFDGWPTQPGTRVAVVGGGVSAVQVALRLARSGQRAHLVSRRPLRKRDFDADPGWLGPKYMRAFSETRDPESRRAMITEARNNGSIPPDVLQSLRVAIDRRKITMHQTEVEALQTDSDLELQLRNGTTLVVDDVLLATGFSQERPGGKMIDELIRSSSLECAPCGFPIVDPALRWHPRIHVSGPLAEIELGPIARNIAGAQRAADRILTAVSSRDAARA